MPTPGGERESILWTTDELGALAVIRVDTSVYSKPALFKTAYWFTNRCYVFLRSGLAKETIEVELRPKAASDREVLENTCREFCNSLLDQQVRQIAIAETGGVRDLLVRKAFFEGSKRSEPPALKEDESSLPDPGEHSRDDARKIGRITGASL